MAHTNDKALRRVADEILKVLLDWRQIDNNPAQRNLLESRIDLHWGKKIKKNIEVTYPGWSKANNPLPVYWQRPWSVENKNHQSRAPPLRLPILWKFPNLGQSADAGEQGIQQTTSSQSPDVTVSHAVATQYFISVSDFLFFISIGKMINKLFGWFYRRCWVTKEVTRQTMAELEQLGICYNEWTIQRKRRLNKSLGRFELFRFLTVTEKELNCKCMRIANFLELNQEQAM